MINILYGIIPFALGIAISPVPIITVILSLFSTRAKWNGPAFILGWALGILVVCILVLIFTDNAKVATVTNPTTFASVIRILLGAFLIFSALGQWKKSHKKGEDVSIPKWLQRIHTVSPFKVFGVGFFFADLTNPKNTALTIAGTLPIANSGFPMQIKVLLIILFIMTSSVGIAIPVIYYLVGGQSAKNVLNGWKSWLISHNNIVMAIMFLVFGIIVLSQGIRGLIL